MSTLAPYRSHATRGSDGFGSLLWAEWTKFRSVRGWVIGLLVGLLLFLGLGVLTTKGSQCGIQNGNGPVEACPAPPAGPGGEFVSDTYYFVHQPLADDGSLTVRVTSLTGLYSTHGGVPAGESTQGLLASMTPGVQPWSKAGIIVTADTAAGSAYAAMMVTGDHGVRMQWDYVNDVAGMAGKVSVASPRWLRLTRSGDVIRGYDSADGVHWTLVGTATLGGLPSVTQAGLFAATPGYTSFSSGIGSTSAKGGGALASGEFDHVSLRGASPAARWAGEAVGDNNVDAGALPVSMQGFTQAGGRFTVSGSGDIAPDVGDGSPIEQTLAGTFAGLIAVVVIGVMFITAEYRRGLIRTTFAATPRRGRVLLAKAVVLAAVVFVTGLVAALIMVPLGERLLRESGNPIIPTSALTEARVVVGTAALLAVCAVLALAVGTLVRRSAGAVTAVIAGIVLPYLLAIIFGILPTGAEEWLVRITPAAAFAVQQTRTAYPQVFAQYTPGNGYFPLAPWAGFAVLCAWAAAALTLAVFVLRRRDA
jgi:ABC-type transport system involved in multi-copper enzyme maturation permease subunit